MADIELQSATAIEKAWTTILLQGAGKVLPSEAAARVGTAFSVSVPRVFEAVARVHLFEKRLQSAEWD